MKKSARSYQKRPEPEPAAFHRITEGLGLDGPLGASGPALLQQGHPEQGAQHCIWGLPESSKEVITHPPGCLCSVTCTAQKCSCLCPLPLVLALGTTDSLALLSPHSPLRYLWTWDGIPQSLPFSRLGSLSSLSTASQEKHVPNTLPTRGLEGKRDEVQLCLFHMVVST